MVALSESSCPVEIGIWFCSEAGMTTRIEPVDSALVAYGRPPARTRVAPSFPLGTATYTYASTGALRSITDVDGGTLTFGSDGSLPNVVIWGGASTAVRGWVNRTYDASFHVASLAVNGGTVATYSRDADDLITSAGAMQIARDSGSGDVIGTTLGAVTTVEQTSNQGEFATLSAAYQGASFYSEEILARDAVGRITLRRDTVADAATQYGYEYDGAGRLSKVLVNGTLARQYTYDANGNRRAHTSASGTETCTYDAQDRLLGCGDTVYVHNLVGQLASKTKTSIGATTSFDYDVFGNLRAAMLPDGRHVEYEIDAQNRRIGKKINGVRQWGLLYQTELAPIAQVDAHNHAVSTFIYANHKHVPDYMQKNGVTYRFVTDHLGSVRMVVNVADGSVAQRIDYDEFGVVAGDTNPGFQPFGFAGGIWDADTGLVRFGARDYDAVTGRWTAKDPILFQGQQSNLYAYVHGDPVNWTDASGTGPIGTAISILCALYDIYSGISAVIDVFALRRQIDALDAKIRDEYNKECPDAGDVGLWEKKKADLGLKLAEATAAGWTTFLLTTSVCAAANLLPF